MSLSASTRSALYSLLAGAFAPPGEPDEPEERHTSAGQAADSRGARNELPWGRQRTSHGLSHTPAARLTPLQPAPHPDVRRSCGETYQRLFVGLPDPAVYPYESCYRDPDRRLMGPWAAQAAAHYARHGLTSDGLLPDHIAAELGFIAYLAARQAEAEARGDVVTAQAYRAEQTAFLHAHLAYWAPHFCQAVLVRTDDPFYQAAARLLQDLLAAELQRGRGAGEQGSTRAREMVSSQPLGSLALPLLCSMLFRADRCTLCGVCADVCAPRALVLEGEATVVRLRFDPDRCDGCAACRRLCPTRAIHGFAPAEAPAARLLVESRVVLCRGCGTPLMPQASLAYLEQRLQRQGEGLLAHLTLCPACRMTR